MDSITQLIRSLLVPGLLALLFMQGSHVFANDNVVLQLRWTHQAQFSGYYVAKEKGYYQEAGLNVEIREGKAGLIPWQEVTSGRADFAVDNTNAFTAFSEGEPLVALAAVLQRSPSIFITLKKNQISTLRDFRQHTVMMYTGAQDPELLALLKSANLQLDELNLVPTTTRLQDLLDGTVDVSHAYITNEPWILDQADIEYQIFHPRHHGINFYSDLIITHRDRLLASPHQVEAFRAASLRGWHYALQHPEEALDIMEQHYAVTKTRDHSRYEMNTLRELIIPEHIELGSMRISHWQQIARDLRRMHLIDDKPLDIKSFLFMPSIDQPSGKPIPWMVVATALLAVTLLSLAGILWQARQLKEEQTLRKQTEQKLRHLSAHDPLTQLPNRAALIEQLTVLLKLAHRHHSTPALLYLDIDGFKAINERMGQVHGDDLLIRFSNRIRNTLRESDIFGRLGSDQFLLIVDESTEEGSSHLAMKVMAQLNQPFTIAEQEVKISASIGIARYTDCGESADELIHRADKAMLKVKRSFKAGFIIAHPPVDSSAGTTRL